MFYLTYLFWAQVSKTEKVEIGASFYLTWNLYDMDYVTGVSPIFKFFTKWDALIDASLNIIYNISIHVNVEVKISTAI